MFLAWLRVRPVTGLLRAPRRVANMLADRNERNVYLESVCMQSETDVENANWKFESDVVGVTFIARGNTEKREPEQLQLA